jgi:hypothetical protein
MSEQARYWTLVKLDPAGGSRVDELAAAKEFFRQRVSQSLEQDTAIQKQLLELARTSIEERDRAVAELCLRCFISHQVEQACIQIEIQFGKYYGFTRNDLFAFVLDDGGAISDQLLALSKQPKANSYELTANSYEPTASKILQKFDPDRASLTTWTSRLVKQHHELNAFLLEQGLCMLSDWAILNDTKPKKLRRVLTQFHHLTEPEVEQAIILLESYHAVYRRDRILQKQKGACPDPTTVQLQEIGDRIQAHSTQSVPIEVILTHRSLTLRYKSNHLHL